LRCHFLIKIAFYDAPFAADAGPRPAKNEIRGYFPVIGFIPGSAPPKIPASRFLGEGYNRLIENGYWR